MHLNTLRPLVVQTEVDLKFQSQFVSPSIKRKLA